MEGREGRGPEKRERGEGLGREEGRCKYARKEGKNK
jgi:hypothetical protein